MIELRVHDEGARFSGLLGLKVHGGLGMGVVCWI